MDGENDDVAAPHGAREKRQTVKEVAASIGNIGRDAFLQSLVQKNQQLNVKKKMTNRQHQDPSDPSLVVQRSLQPHSGKRMQGAGGRGPSEKVIEKPRGYPYNVAIARKDPPVAAEPKSHKSKTPRQQQQSERTTTRGYPYNARRARPHAAEEIQKGRVRKESLEQPDLEDGTVGEEQDAYELRSYRVEDGDQAMPPQALDHKVGKAQQEGP